MVVDLGDYPIEHDRCEWERVRLLGRTILHSLRRKAIRPAFNAALADATSSVLADVFFGKKRKSQGYPALRR
jgi:hypothetical protein